MTTAESIIIAAVIAALGLYAAPDLVALSGIFGVLGAGICADDRASMPEDIRRAETPLMADDAEAFGAHHIIGRAFPY